jgi:transcriptional regulator with XRE-family HTH domain
MSNIGKRIKGIRLSIGMTQKELAARIGIKPPSLSEIESGETKQPAGDTLLKIAAVLNTNPAFIQTGKGSPVAPAETSVDESEVISLYQALPPHLRAAWMASGRALMASAAPKSKTNPFPTKVK